uniref:Uncharacterized protein n=1 Tax=Arundo donax TaxID=35708 RepID=A0A0A8Z3C8_ARUDO
MFLAELIFKRILFYFSNSWCCWSCILSSLRSMI